MAEFFGRYKTRLRKLVKTACTAMIESAIAWNNQEKLIEANSLFEGFQSEFITWGVKRKTMLDMQHTLDIDGEPISINL